MNKKNNILLFFLKSLRFAGSLLLQHTLVSPDDTGKLVETYKNVTLYSIYFIFNIMFKDT